MFCKSYYDFFATLANRTNQLIINVLADGPKNVTQITKETNLEQSKISHALRRLSECKFVDYKQSGKERIYTLNKETILPILKLADQHAHKMCTKCKKVEKKLVTHF